MTPIVDIQNLSKRFLLHHDAGQLKVRVIQRLRPGRRQWVEDFWALRAVTLGIGQGEALGLVGRNGSGKSTLLKLIAGLQRPTSGHLFVAAGARLATMIELGVGFHGELTGRENVFLNAAIYGLRRTDVDARYARIVDYAGLEHFMDVPLKTYSTGMQMRLGFAVAAHLDPDVLLIDEIFAVGDQTFQEKCIRTLRDFQSGGGTIVFVSHAPGAIKAICDRVCVLDRGQIAFEGPVDAGLARYDTLTLAAPEPTDAEPRGAQAREPGFRAGPADIGLPEAEMDRAWHRRTLGPRWAECGDWGAELLRAAGLQPAHFVLDLGCGSLATARHLLPCLDQSHYWGYELDRDLFFDGATIELARAGVWAERGHFMINRTFDLSECPYQFDFVLAASFFNRLPLHDVARALAVVQTRLRPGARIFVSWLEQPDPTSGAAVQFPLDVVGRPDAPPYCHAFAMLEGICAALGLTCSRVPDAGHPRGESVALITGRP